MRAGMALGETLVRCPRLTLVAPDAVAASEAWEGVLLALEGIGAGVESVRPGPACFAARGTDQDVLRVRAHRPPRD